MLNFYEVYHHVNSKRISWSGGMVFFRVWFDAEGEHVEHELMAQTHHQLARDCEKMLPRLKMRASREEGKNRWADVVFTFRRKRFSDTWPMLRKPVFPVGNTQVVARFDAPRMAVPSLKYERMELDLDEVPLTEAQVQVQYPKENLPPLVPRLVAQKLPYSPVETDELQAPRREPALLSQAPEAQVPQLAFPNQAPAYLPLETDQIQGLKPSPELLDEPPIQLPYPANDLPRLTAAKLPYTPMETERLQAPQREPSLLEQTPEVKTPQLDFPNQGPAYLALETDAIQTVSLSRSPEKPSRLPVQPSVNLPRAPLPAYIPEASAAIASDTVWTQGEPAETISFAYLNPMILPINLDSVIREIVYPQAAITQRIEGVVRFRLLLDANGQYLRHLSLSAHPFLNDACEGWLPYLRYAPLLQKSKKHAFWTTIEFIFDLKRGGPEVFYRAQEVVQDNDF
ncbi:MAG: energy transducer TonB [Bacteroidota bacterium]